jgi:NhaP-type Na+/H+ and K+/H+ antiporter
VFSVLGRREVMGRSGTVLEGESGTNDPVGIAVMVAVLTTTGSGGLARVAEGTLEFAREMAVGAGVGVLGGLVLVWLMRRIPLPGEACTRCAPSSSSALCTVRRRCSVVRGFSPYSLPASRLET